MNIWVPALRTLPRHPPILSSVTSARRLAPLASRVAPRYPTLTQAQLRSFAGTRHRWISTGPKDDSYDNSNARPAIDLSQKITKEEEEDFQRRLAEDRDKQIRTPWHHEGSEEPPVARQRQATAMTKGKLLTTPSRMLKLILPLTTKDLNSDRKDAEPLALLVHPQQPLSYLERLIQAELPTIRKESGGERIPAVYFWAEDSVPEDSVLEDDLEPSEPEKPSHANDAKEKKVRDQSIEKTDEVPEKDDHHGSLDKADEIIIDGKRERTGKLTPPKPANRTSPQEGAEMRGGHGEGGVEYYSGHGHETPSSATPRDARFVRWSSSTEIGDFIRDAARGREFAVEIEGAPEDIRVGVPSFNDRTYYLRMRLRKTSRKISDMAALKKECDELAHKGAQRVALGGFGVLCGWWYLVYRLTFETDLGWDVMEPVTYLVGLSSLIAGYVWFLYHNREVSYRSAMNFTISRRQSKLYEQRGFDLQKWELLIDEGNALRKEIKAVANEYDVEWDELKDEKDDAVAKALKEQREKKGNGGEKEKDGEEEDKGGPIRPGDK